MQQSYFNNHTPVRAPCSDAGETQFICWKGSAVAHRTGSAKSRRLTRKIRQTIAHRGQIANIRRFMMQSMSPGRRASLSSGHRACGWSPSCWGFSYVWKANAINIYIIVIGFRRASIIQSWWRMSGLWTARSGLAERLNNFEYARFSPTRGMG